MFLVTNKIPKKTENKRRIILERKRKLAPRNRKTMNHRSEVLELKPKIIDNHSKATECPTKVLEGERDKEPRVYEQSEEAKALGPNKVVKEIKKQDLKWRKVPIKESEIIAETDASHLIALPERSAFKGYCFWHPKRLVRPYNDRLMVSYNGTFRFKLTKSEKRNDEYIVVDEIMIDADEFGEAYHDELVRYCVRSIG